MCISHHCILLSFPTRRSSDLRDFVHAAAALGAGHARILGRHLLVNALPIVIVQASLLLGQTILIESGLRSEEHTSELQSLTNIVFRLLLEKKKICKLII